MSNIPTSIGRYEILGSIGRGGMGSLYLALDPKLDRQLAIKLLRDDDDDLRERFAREARAAARLRHPNIVTIFDVGEHEGQPFIAMEYIQGQTLGEIVRGNVAMPLVRKLELMESLCDGLGFAHKGGIIHRDIKPANLMLDADGSLKILDFGIARASESSGMTQAGMLIGTLNYMSPEQVSGQPVDLRSDLFAVGAVFYELLSYRQAFPGGLMAGILNKIVSGQPEPLPSIVPDIDPQIVRIVERALEKDPDRRYPDLAAMRQEIVVARARLASVAPTHVLGTTPAVDDSGETRYTPPPSSSSRRTADLEGLAKRRAEQIQGHLAEAERKLAAGDADGAIATAEQALLLDANHAKAHGLIDRARAVIEKQQIEAALEAAAGGIASGDFALATQFIDRAAEIDPKAARLSEIRRSLDDAVQRREEAQQREALEKRVREVVADAERQFADGRRDDGVALLAGFRPSHPLVAQALERLRADAARLADEERAAADRAAQQAAEVAERARREEAARIAREREKAANDAIKEAKRVRGPEAALAILRPALERDPDNVDLLRAVGANEAELQRAQAKAAEEARRQAERAEREKAEREKAAAAAAAAAQMIPGVPDADTDDRTILLKRDVPKPAVPAAVPPPAPGVTPDMPTMAVPKAAVSAPAAQAPVVAKAPEAKTPAVPKAPEVKAPAAAKAPPPVPAPREAPAAPRPLVSSEPAASGGVSNAVKYGGAAAAVLLAVVGFVVFGGSGGSTESPAAGPDAATAVATTDVAANNAGSATPPVDTAPAPPVENTPPATAQTPATPPTTLPAAQQPARGQQPAAPSAQDRQLASLLADAQTRREGGNLPSAIEAVEGGLKIRPRDPRFMALAGEIRQDAERRTNTARGSAQAVGQTALSHVTFREGDDLATQARQAAVDGRDIDAARTFMAAEVRYNTAASEGRRIAEQQAAAAAAAAAAARQVTPVAAAQPTPAQEEAAIRAVVERYRQAYNSLDARAVQAVFPSAPIPLIRKAFTGLDRQTVTINNLSVTLDPSGTTATA
ncbi:MAG: serine/threonine protein kinase, partial [Acidobacteria bacterium]|nr:serine/threonine protein kinase [Acidobacteriota bacterium]